jgi:hypothetical protein
VYILDQVRAMEKEMLKNIKQQGLDIEPQIVVVNRLNSLLSFMTFCVMLLLLYIRSLGLMSEVCVLLFR